MSTVPHILIIVASTRTTRFADFPLGWVKERTSGRSDFSFEVLDLRENLLPFYDLQSAPSMAPRAYETDLAREIGEKLDAADGFLVITNEYNHGYSAALKNLLDHYFVEFNRKPISYVGYGNAGGSRAIEQLRQVAGELDMVSVRPTVHVFGPQLMEIRQDPSAAPRIFASLEPRLELLLSDLHWWASALHTARAAG
ncbi:MAG TPA: NAD(P)H-dependent oxidoreductase [Galbitalea sp.]|jgi:NAD(P)H-dependent FMN reductase